MFYIIFVLIAIVMLAYHWTNEGELITLQGILLAPQSRRDEIRTLLSEIESKNGAYIRGQLLLCLIVGGMATVSYLVLGIPYAFVLGLVMTIAEAVPMIGPLIGAVPAVLVTASMAPDMTLWVILALSAIQMLENNLIVPLEG